MTIMRFNWPFYVVAVVILAASLGGLILFPQYFLRIVCVIVFASTGYSIIASVWASHVIYDCSDLYRFGWVERALRGAEMREAVFCHSGFDEASVGLREKTSSVQWKVLDHFDERQMTEASIRRARAMYPPSPDTLPSRHDAWPLSDASTDIVFGFLAIHELRNEADRTAWFRESKRCLRKDGRVVLVEHVRDTVNFLVFGPGFLHFHSPKSWRKCWQAAGFDLADEFRITPFIRVFVLKVA